MAQRADIVICGTGEFAARILFDIAATVPEDIAVAVIGRDQARLDWLRTGARARAAMFASGVRVDTMRIGDFTAAALSGPLAALRPRVVANTASLQGGRKPNPRPDRWTRLVQEAGLGVTAALQAALSLDIATAVATAAPCAAYVSCLYPDVLNPMIAAAGRPIASGIGNVAILAHAFAGTLDLGGERLRMLAQHAALAAFRRPAEQRNGRAPLRLWIGAQEIDDAFARFADVKLAPEPVIDVSGASGVPLFRAIALGRAWTGHAPGPNGLPGGYPVRLADGRLELDLPPGLDAQAAIAWNQAFEAANGVVIGPDGAVRYTGRVEAALREVSPDLAAGFRMGEFPAALDALCALRARLRDAP